MRQLQSPPLLATVVVHNNPLNAVFFVDELTPKALEYRAKAFRAGVVSCIAIAVLVIASTFLAFQLGYDMNKTFIQVEEHLRPLARGTAIAPDTELYLDLGIYGDDLAFDVVLWATREFDMQGSVNIARCAPGESPFPFLRQRLRRFFGMKPHDYQSLTVADLIAAIDAKRWPE